jgi:hypothetical protein
MTGPIYVPDDGDLRKKADEAAEFFAAHPQNETSLARIFVDRWGSRVVFINGLGWHIYSEESGLWSRDTDGTMDRFAKQLGPCIREKTIYAVLDPKEAAAIARWAARAGDYRTIENVRSSRHQSLA